MTFDDIGFPRQLGREALSSVSARARHRSFYFHYSMKPSSELAQTKKKPDQKAGFREEEPCVGGKA